jgi:hypothetical protein
MNGRGYLRQSDEVPNVSGKDARRRLVGTFVINPTTNTTGV